MTITMHNTRTLTIPEITQLLTSTEAVAFRARNREETYPWIEQNVARDRIPEG